MRTKITFNSVNADKFTIINPKDISEVRIRIQNEMKPIIKEQLRNEILSIQDAKKLIINI